MRRPWSRWMPDTSLGEPHGGGSWPSDPLRLPGPTLDAPVAGGAQPHECHGRAAWDGEVEALTVLGHGQRVWVATRLVFLRAAAQRQPGQEQTKPAGVLGYPLLEGRARAAEHKGQKQLSVRAGG